MALIRDAIRIDGWARAQHRDHTGDVRPEWCPLCHQPEPEPPTPAAPAARPAKCQECGVYAATEVCAAVTCPQRSPAEPRMYPTAEAYIAGIRNAAKRAYAEAYARHMRHEGPEPERGALSYMAAQAVRIHLHSLGVTPARPPRPRYRLTPEGMIPCASITSPIVPTATITPTPSVPVRTASRAARRWTSSASAGPAATSGRTPKRKSRGAGAYAGLLDRLEAIGATFCPDCYAYQWPDHTQHLTRGPIVPLGQATLAEPCVVDGLDGQSELVTIQEEREERAA